jgi:hypothetical protein
MTEVAALPLVLILRNIEEFNTMCQGKLYELFDAFHYAGSSRARVVAVTGTIGPEESMEKRIRSRFLHRHVYFPPDFALPKTNVSRTLPLLDPSLILASKPMAMSFVDYLASMGLSVVEIALLYAIATEETYISTPARIEKILKQCLPVANRKVISGCLPKLEFLELVQVHRGVVRLGLCLLETGNPRQLIKTIGGAMDLPTNLEQFMSR